MFCCQVCAAVSESWPCLLLCRLVGKLAGVLPLINFWWGLRVLHCYCMSSKSLHICFLCWIALDFVLFDLCKSCNWHVILSCEWCVLESPIAWYLLLCLPAGASSFLLIICLAMFGTCDPSLLHLLGWRCICCLPHMTSMGTLTSSPV